MTPHVFTRGSELFVITEKLPTKPEVYIIGVHHPDQVGLLCPGQNLDKLQSCDSKCPCYDQIIAYQSELSRLKENAVRVEEIESSHTFMVERREEGWCKTSPNGWQFLNEGELYPLECEVQIKEKWICQRCGNTSESEIDNCKIDRCKGYLETVAVLKPLPEQPAKEEEQEEMWGEVIRFIQNSGSGGIVFSIHKEALKSKFHITRK